MVFGKRIGKIITWRYFFDRFKGPEGFDRGRCVSIRIISMTEWSAGGKKQIDEEVGISSAISHGEYVAIFGEYLGVSFSDSHINDFELIFFKEFDFSRKDFVEIGIVFGKDAIVVTQTTVAVVAKSIEITWFSDDGWVIGS